MVDYDKFAKTFSNSRKNMKWDEIDYIISFLKGKKNLKILDIGCGNGRLLRELVISEININDYLGIDLSKGLLDEAKNLNPGYNFIELDMNDLKNINKKFDNIFLIASFHHLKNYNERNNVLKQIFELLDVNGKAYITNWALNSQLNLKKYENSRIEGSINEFGNFDYNVKIGDSSRFYHSFNLDELKYLFIQVGFNILENFLFENNRNYVSIIEKK